MAGVPRVRVEVLSPYSFLLLRESARRSLLVHVYRIQKILSLILVIFKSYRSTFFKMQMRLFLPLACTAIMQQALLIHNRVDMIEYANRPGGGQQYEADEAPGTYENFNHQADRFYYGRSS